jgi:hypothetical protein
MTNARDIFSAFGERLAGLGRALRKDPISTFLLIASIALSILFFSLLDSIAPSSPGREVALSHVDQLAESNQIATATPITTRAW